MCRYKLAHDQALAAANANNNNGTADANNDNGAAGTAAAATGANTNTSANNTDDDVAERLRQAHLRASSSFRPAAHTLVGNRTQGARGNTVDGTTTTAGTTAADNNNNDVGGIQGVAHRTTAIIGTPPNVTNNNKRKAPAQVTASVGKKKKRDTEFYMKVKCRITEQGIAHIPTTNDDGMNYATANIYDVDKGTEEEQPMPVCAFASNTSNVAEDSILQHLRDQFRRCSSTFYHVEEKQGEEEKDNE